MSICHKCGRCCWDWKNNDPSSRCNHLADDLRTCLVWGRLAEVNRSECDRPMDIHHAVDLHPECGYMQAWRKEGRI